MSIKEINDTSIEHICDNCGATRQIDFDVLKRGLEQKDGEPPVPENVIPLPPCDNCPTVEFLFVSEGESKHRHLVNTLSHRLQKKGQT